MLENIGRIYQSERLSLTYVLPGRCYTFFMRPHLPILFHDIDGVLFGEYDGHYQLRPGVKTWLTWPHDQFAVVWLTLWEMKRIEHFLSSLYLDTFRPIIHADLANYASKAVWLAEAVPKLAGRAMVWIDDEEEPVSGLKTVHVERVGKNELERVRKVMLEILRKQSVRPGG